MIEVRQTEIFARWLANLRDGRAQARINACVSAWNKGSDAILVQLIYSAPISRA